MFGLSAELITKGKLATVKSADVSSVCPSQETSALMKHLNIGIPSWMVDFYTNRPKQICANRCYHRSLRVYNLFKMFPAFLEMNWRNRSSLRL